MDNNAIESNIILHIALMENSNERHIPQPWPFLRVKYQTNPYREIICINIKHQYLLEKLTK